MATNNRSIPPDSGNSALPSRRSSLRIGTLVKSATLDQRITEISGPSSMSSKTEKNVVPIPETTTTKEEPLPSTVKTVGRKKRKNHDPDLETAIALSLVETYKQSRGPSPKLSLTAIKPKRKRNRITTTHSTSSSSSETTKKTMGEHQDDDSPSEETTTTIENRTNNDTSPYTNNVYSIDSNTKENTLPSSSSNINGLLLLSSSSSSYAAIPPNFSSSAETSSSTNPLRVNVSGYPNPSTLSSPSSGKFKSSPIIHMLQSSSSRREFSPNSGIDSQRIVSPLLSVNGSLNGRFSNHSITPSIESVKESSALSYTTPGLNRSTSNSQLLPTNTTWTPHRGSTTLLPNCYSTDPLSQEFGTHDNIPTEDDEEEDISEFEEENDHTVLSINKTPPVLSHPQTTPGSHYLPIVTPSSDSIPANSMQTITPQLVLEHDNENTLSSLSTNNVVSGHRKIDQIHSLLRAVSPDILSQEFENRSEEEHHNDLCHGSDQLEEHPVAIVPDILSQEPELGSNYSGTDHHPSSSIEINHPHQAYVAVVPDFLSQEFGTNDVYDTTAHPGTAGSDSPVSLSPIGGISSLRAIDPDIISQEMEFISPVEDVMNDSDTPAEDNAKNKNDDDDMERNKCVLLIPPNHQSDMFISPSSGVSSLSSHIGNITTNHTIIHDGPASETLISLSSSTSSTSLPNDDTSATTETVARTILNKLSSLPPLPSSLRCFVAQHEASSPCEDHWFAGATMDYPGYRTTAQHTLSLQTGTTVLPDDIRNHSPDDLAYIFTVMDGHGGPIAAEFASTHLPSRILQETRHHQTITEIINGIKYAFLAVDKSFLHTYKNIANFQRFGTCVTLVLIRKVGIGSASRWLTFTANAGDSRCVLASEQKRNEMSNDNVVSESRPPSWVQFQGDRNSLLDTRIHNTVADAAGIPSLVCDQEANEILALVSQGSTIHSVLQEFSNQITTVSGTNNAPSSLAVNDYFSSRLHASVSGDRIQQAMCWSGGRNFDSNRSNRDRLSYPSSSSSSFPSSLLHSQSLGRTISKAAAMGIGGSLLHYALTFLHPTKNTNRSAEFTGDLLSLERKQCVDQLLFYRRLRMQINGMLAIPLSMDHTCSNPVEADDVQLRTKEVQPFRFNSTPGAPLKSIANKGVTTYGTNLMEAAIQGCTNKNRTSLTIGQMRVGGSLMVTRALGDLYLKTEEHSFAQYPGCPYISGEPEVTWRIFQPGDRFLVVACDGIWDVVTNAQAVEIVAQSLCDEVHVPILQQFGKEDRGNDSVPVVSGSTTTVDDYTSLPKEHQQLHRAIPYFSSNHSTSSNSTSDSTNNGTHQDALDHESIDTEVEIGYSVPSSLGIYLSSTANTHRSGSYSQSHHSSSSQSLPSDYGGNRNRFDSDTYSVSSVSRSSSVTGFETDTSHRIVPVSHISNVDDVFFGNPAQRLIGAAIVQQLKRQKDASYPLDNTAIDEFGIINILQLPCKTPSTITSEIKNGRRGFHDDMTAIVIVLPSFMIYENMMNENGPVMEISTTGLPNTAVHRSLSSLSSRNIHGTTTVSTDRLPPHFVTEGIETFPFRSLTERFQSTTNEYYFEWRNRSREERIHRGIHEWPIISHTSSLSSHPSAGLGNNHNRQKYTFPSSQIASSYGSYVYQQRSMQQQPYDSFMNRSKSLYSNGTDSKNNQHYLSSVSRSNSFNVVSSSSQNSNYDNGPVAVRRSVSDSYNAKNNDNQSVSSTNSSNTSTSRQSILKNWWTSTSTGIVNSGKSTAKETNDEKSTSTVGRTGEMEENNAAVSLPLAPTTNGTVGGGITSSSVGV